MEIRKANLKFKEKLNPLPMVTKIFLHHAVSSINHTIYDIHQWHINRGWIGCGYNFVIDSKGIVWEGRGFNKGSHSGSAYNNTSIGICLIGNFEIAPPTTEQYKALAELCEMLMKKYGIGIGNIFPHKAVAPTKCPGKLFSFENLYKEITKLQTPPKPKEPVLRKNEWYAVQVGAFKTRPEAEERAKELKEKGFDSYIYLKEV